MIADISQLIKELVSLMPTGDDGNEDFLVVIPTIVIETENGRHYGIVSVDKKNSGQVRLLIEFTG